MTTPDITWFPDFAVGLPSANPAQLDALITAAWKLAIDGRALAEDLEGGADVPSLVAVLKLKLAELLQEIDLDLVAAPDIAEDHLLPLALQRGLAAVAHLDGATLAAVLGLDGRATDLAAVWTALLDGFPGDVPNPLAPDGQGPALRALRAWSKLCKATERDDAFLKPLIKAI